jgi:cytoskeletal protein RodZ
MNNGKESLSFGRYLQAIRLEKNISLEQVAAQTRIGPGNLMLVEQEDHEQLPAAVFVKGFLRSYAAAIGADGDEAVRRYEAQLDVVQKIAESEASAGKSKTSLWLKLSISLGLFVCMVTLSILIISNPRHSPESEITSHQAPPTAAKNPDTGEDQEGRADKKMDLAPRAVNPAPETLQLQIAALEDTWVKVIIDEKDPAEYTFSSGDQLELEALNGYNLLIGSASGIKLTLNGKPVLVPGESGEVVTMHLP